MKTKNTILVLCSIAVALLMVSTVTARPAVVESTNVEAGMSHDLTSDQMEEVIPTFTIDGNEGSGIVVTESDVIEFMQSDDFLEIFSQMDLTVFSGLEMPQELVDVLSSSEEVAEFTENVDLNTFVSANPSAAPLTFRELFTVLWAIYSVIWGVIRGDFLFEETEDLVEMIIEYYGLPVEEGSIAYGFIWFIAWVFTGYYDFLLVTPYLVLQAFWNWITGNNDETETQTTRTSATRV